jgi:hypothetical protein
MYLSFDYNSKIKRAVSLRIHNTRLTLFHNVIKLCVMICYCCWGQVFDANCTVADSQFSKLTVTGFNNYNIHKIIM